MECNIYQFSSHPGREDFVDIMTSPVTTISGSSETFSTEESETAKPIIIITKTVTIPIIIIFFSKSDHFLSRVIT